MGTIPRLLSVLGLVAATALAVPPVGAQTGPVTLAPAGRGQGAVARPGGFDALAAARGDGPLTFPRQVAWWPFMTGPHYGEVELRDEDLPDDVLLTHVGSFRIGQGLPIPAELTGSLAGIASGRSQHFLLQMRDELVTAEWPKALASLGATVMGRTPVNGVVVRADRAAYERLASSPLVQFIEPYHPAYKIHPTVGQVSQATAEEAASPLFQLEVTLWPDEPAAPTADLLRRIGVTVTQVSGDTAFGQTLHVTAHAALIPEIARLESVALIGESAPKFVLGNRGALFMGGYELWVAGIDGDGQVLAAIDTGLSVDAGDHADTRSDSGWVANGTSNACATLASYPNCYNPTKGTHPSAGNCHRKIVCYRPANAFGGQGDYSACDSDVSGSATHGQIVASVMVGNPTRGRVPPTRIPSPTDADPAQDPNSFRARAFGNGFYDDGDGNGYFSEFQDPAFDGIAKGARIVFYDAGAGCPDPSQIVPGDKAAAIGAARADHGATVMNLSWGSTSILGKPIYTSGGRQTDTAIVNNPIMVVTQAAGNNGSLGNEGRNVSVSTLSDDATCKNCIVVGGSAGDGGSAWDATSEGPAYFGSPVNKSRLAPLLLAEAIDYGCRSVDTGSENQTGPATCENQMTYGTSIAAPQLAAATALIREYFDQGFYNGKPTRAISARLVKALLIASAAPITGGKGFVSPDRFNNIWGYGRVDLRRALPLVERPETVSGLTVHDLPPGDLNGDGTTPDGVSDLALPGTISGGQTLTAEFGVNGVTDDLVVTLVWDDSLGAASETGVLNDDLDLVVRYCGANGTCGDADDTAYQGNAFSEDPERDGTRNADLLVGGAAGSDPDGWWYTLPDSFITAGGGTVSQWRDQGNNTEAVFVATFANRPDQNYDGTADFPALCTNPDPNCTGGTARTGKWRVEVKAAASVPSGKPFSIAITGPVVAGSTVRFSINPIVCNGETRVVVEEKAAAGTDLDPACVAPGNCPASVISARTVVEVLDAGGAVRDTETGLAFDTPPAGSLHFRTTSPLPVSVDPTAGSPNNGILYVQHGWRVRVRYSDHNGTATVVREAKASLDCQPSLEVYVMKQPGRDTFFVLDGGCDDDRYLDQGETFGLTFQIFNYEGELRGAELELKVVDAETCAASEDDLCRRACPPVSFIRVDNPIQRLGMLAPWSLQQSTFSLSVVGTPPGRRRLEFVLGLRSEKAGLGEMSCQPYRDITAFELLAQADDEVRYFTTDCQTGCTLNFDRNGDERLDDRIPPDPFDPFDFALRGKDETAIQYLSLTTPSRTSGCIHCAQNAAVGGPWDFDTNDEGFRSGITPGSKLSDTDTDGCSNWGEDLNWNNVLDPGENQAEPWSTSGLDQNWSTAGGCGFMTGTSATQGGVWHTGHIGAYSNNGGVACRPNESICEQYDTNDGMSGAASWAELLRSPAVHPISLGPDDADGYEWKTQILDWAWNQQSDWLRYASAYWTVDLDPDNEGRAKLGVDWWHGRVFGSGLVSGDVPSWGASAFAPTDDDPASATFGDSRNGTKGNNRSGVRGCWFNDLNTIDVDGTGPGTVTAAWRRVANPRPLDDDCDNDFTLGADGCPGVCGIDDDANGEIDDALEVCPCRRCFGGSNANKPCLFHEQCNTSVVTAFACLPATSATGVPTPYGDDICGDGSTDETTAATFGTNTTLRQQRNFRLKGLDGHNVNSPLGDIVYSPLEDLYPPVGDTWQTEIWFYVEEAWTEDALPESSYGLAIDDMVIEWQETHPVAQAGNRCSTAGNPGFIGQCATLSVGIVAAEGDTAVPVTVIDPVPADNLVNCDADPAVEVEVVAYSESEPAGETFCLDPIGSAGIEFRGLVRTSSRVARPGDGAVYVAYDAAITPTVTVWYIDRNDGKNVVSNGPDGRPGVANFDDDGDGTVDDADELCPESTDLAAGRSPHRPGRAARYSDDSCGCVDNPLTASFTAWYGYADLRIVNVLLRDGVGGQGTGDGDGFADPNETVVVDVVVRNGTSDFALENVLLTLQSTSPYIRDIRDDTIRVPRLESNAGGLPGTFDTCDTRFGTNQNNEPNGTRCPSNDHFVFTVAGPSELSRTSLAEDLSSTFQVSIQGLGKAEPESTLTLDLPMYGTTVAQTFRVIHNLDKPAVTAAADVVETFESFARDKQYAGQSACNTGSNKCLLDYFRPHNTGDDAAELDGNRCQDDDPDNPSGSMSRSDCQLGAGFDNAEYHWHLHAPGAAGTGVCENIACPDGGRSATTLSGSSGRKSLSSTNLREGDTTPTEGDGMTEDFNRMTWVEWHRAGTASGPGNTFQLGFPDPLKTVTAPRAQNQYTGPELTFWTQLSIFDKRLWVVEPLSPGDYAFSAARVYACIDHDTNGQCDTRETGDLDGSEKWEPLEAWYTPESSFRVDNLEYCMYDPADDGSTEGDFFANSTTSGPSSTCRPNVVDTCVGRTRSDDASGRPFMSVLGDACFPETGVESTEGVKGYVGGALWTDARWLLKRYRLDEFAGRKVLFRWHMTPGGLPDADTCAAILGPYCGNRDDGWFIDDIRVNGLAQPLTLLIDNAGETVAPPDPTICVPGEIEPALAAIPYPTFDTELFAARPAAACSDPAVATCDFNNDDAVDAASDTATSDAPLRPFELTGIMTPSATCVGGDLEYRFRDSGGTTLLDWNGVPSNWAGDLIVTPSVATTYFLDVRCSASPTTCSATDSVTIGMPGCSIAATSLTLSDRTTIRWQGSLVSGTSFDTAKGDVTTLRAAHGSFSGASCLENDGTDTTSTDAPNPGAGSSFYYLARCNGASWEDPPNTGQQGTRGDTLAACP